MKLVALSLGIGRPAEPVTIRDGVDRQLFRSLHLTPWPRRFRYGWVLGWNGIYWHRAIGITGPDWNDGKWPGGGSWHRHGPVATCSWRRRGSLRADIRFERAMGCSCMHLIWRWVRGRGTVTHRSLCRTGITRKGTL